MYLHMYIYILSHSTVYIYIYIYIYIYTVLCESLRPLEFLPKKKVLSQEV